MNIENNLSCIYKITSPNGKVYIGQTINLKNRRRKYKSLNFKGQIKLWNSHLKYEWNPHDCLEVVEKCLIEQLDERERYWISFYNSYAEGLNCDLGGRGRRGYSHSLETKEKLRRANLGKTHTEQSKRKISETLKAIPKEIRSTWKTLKGTSLTEEHIAKIKQAKKDNPFKMSESQRKKVSEFNIGNKNMLGKIHSEETKRRISEAKKGKINTSRDKKIFNVTTGDVYESQREASKILNISVSGILRVCNGDRKTHKGFKFEYYDEEKDSNTFRSRAG